MFTSIVFLSVLATKAFAFDPTNVTTLDIGNSLMLGRRVSYYLVDGIAIVDGDVIFGPEEELLRMSRGGGGKRSLSLFESQRGRMWPNGVIRYKWESQEAKDGRGYNFSIATQRWINMLPFLKFQDTGDIDPTLVEDVITLRATTGRRSCNSPIGKTSYADANYIQLDDDCGGAGTYTHELGHCKS